MKRWYKGIKAADASSNNYPSTDRYHLNETWNNVGSAYYELGKYYEAKAAWEKALFYMPDDPVAKDNLNTFIYKNINIPKEIRESQSLN